MELEYPGCGLCGSQAHRALFSARDLRYGIEGEFKIVECLECKLWYLRPRPSTQEISAYYPGDYAAYKKVPTKQSAFKKALDSVTNAYLQLFLGNVFPTYYFSKHVSRFSTPGNPPRILDVGCGSGKKLAHLMKAGWEAYGVDFDERAVANSCALGIKCNAVTNGQEIPHAADYFDAVMSWHSIEHHFDPFATLSEMHRVLKPGGYGIISVPTGDNLGIRLFGANWGPLEAPRHLYHFTEDTLSRMCRKAGFEVVSSYHDMTFYGLFLDQEILESIENVASAHGIKIRIPRIDLLSTLVRDFMLPFNKYLGKVWRGGSLILHISKP